MGPAEIGPWPTIPGRGLLFFFHRVISACNSAPIQRNYVTIQRRGHGNRADVTVFYLNMNKVDYLTSVSFSTLPIEQKLEIKRLHI